MLALIKTILYITLNTGQSISLIPIKVCMSDLSHLNYSSQVEISIGCSEVDGQRHYPYWKIEGLYGK